MDVLVVQSRTAQSEEEVVLINCGHSSPSLGTEYVIAFADATATLLMSFGDGGNEFQNLAHSRSGLRYRATLLNIKSGFSLWSTPSPKLSKAACLLTCTINCRVGAGN